MHFFRNTATGLALRQRANAFCPAGVPYLFILHIQDLEFPGPTYLYNIPVAVGRGCCQFYHIFRLYKQHIPLVMAAKSITVALFASLVLAAPLPGTAQAEVESVNRGQAYPWPYSGEKGSKYGLWSGRGENRKESSASNNPFGGFFPGTAGRGSGSSAYRGQFTLVGQQF
jgi:hypothetical protein